MDIEKVIKTKYPGVDLGPGGNVMIVQDPDDSLNFFRWDLSDPQPTIAELEAYAASPEYLTEILGQAKAGATDEINRQANEKVIQRGILTGQLFFTANVADIGFLVTEWRSEGRPTKPEPQKYYRAYREAAAYAETSDPTMTAFKMLTIWEAQWNWMRNSFADLNYTRRKALEQVKLAQSEAEIATVLSALLWSIE